MDSMRKLVSLAMVLFSALPTCRVSSTTLFGSLSRAAAPNRCRIRSLGLLKHERAPVSTSLLNLRGGSEDATGERLPLVSSRELSTSADDLGGQKFVTLANPAPGSREFIQ